MLFDKTTLETSYHYCSVNTSVFGGDMQLVTNDNDFQRVLATFQSRPLEDLIPRPNTKFRLDMVTNVCAVVIPLSTTFIGGGVSGEDKLQRMPNYLQGRKDLLCFDRDRHTGKSLLGDNLCIFRCIAAKLDKFNQPTETRVQGLLQRYCVEKGINPEDYALTMNDLPDVEKIFGVAIWVRTCASL